MFSGTFGSQAYARSVTYGVTIQD